MKLVITLLAMSSCLSTLDAATEVHNPILKLLAPLFGEWQGSYTSEAGSKYTTITKSEYDHISRLITISHIKGDGFGPNSYVSLQIAEQGIRGKFHELHAVFYRGKSWYYKCTTQEPSKIWVFEKLFPELKQPKFLVLDFSECPEKPPTFKTSDKKPSANKSEESTEARR